MPSWQAAFAALQKVELREAYARMLIGDSELPEASLARLRQAGLLLLVEGEYRVNESFYAETLEAEQRQKPQGLQRYLSLGKLEGLPQNRTDREALLRLLCGRLFEPGKHYSEAEVNGLLEWSATMFRGCAGRWWITTIWRGFGMAPITGSANSPHYLDQHVGDPQFQIHPRPGAGSAWS